MNLKKSLVFALLCLAVVSAGARAGSVQQLQPLEPEWLSQMYAEGWQKVQEGVLQRVSEEGKRETFSYGAEGMQWVVQRTEQRAAYLKSRYDASPSEDLAEMIEQLERQILRLEETIDSAPSAESFDGEALADCAISLGNNYDVDVSAGPQTGAQGVTASASAYFHNDCGILGETYTTAEAHATAATGETHLTHFDPKSGGSWLDSYSSASANGSTACRSYAAGMVNYPGLPTAYIEEQENFSCNPLDKISTYTLDSPSWAQTGNGTIGSLTLNNASGITLIGSNYGPIATSGLPQAGISFAKSTVSKLESQPVNTVSDFNAPVIQVEITGRLREVPAATTVLVGMGHWISGIGSYGLRIATDQLQRLVVSSLNGTTSFTVHNASVTLGLNETTNDSYRWVWTENSPGSSTGTAQWWRKVSGVWQTWGTSKSDMRRPVGHANTRFRLHAHENGSPQAVGFDFLEASITFAAR